MPIYEYHCAKCGEDFEKFVRSQASLAELRCPHCGSFGAETRVSLFGTSGAGKGTSSVTQGACAPTSG